MDGGGFKELNEMREVGNRCVVNYKFLKYYFDILFADVAEILIFR